MESPTGHLIGPQTALDPVIRWGSFGLSDGSLTAENQQTNQGFHGKVISRSYRLTELTGRQCQRPACTYNTYTRFYFHFIHFLLKSTQKDKKVYFSHFPLGIVLTLIM